MSGRLRQDVLREITDTGVATGDDVISMADELCERRAADLSDEEREALCALLIFMRKDISPSHRQERAALAAIERLIESNQ
jgi:hypothetical protein